VGPDYASALRRLYALGQGRMLPGRERLRAVLGIAATDGLLADAPVVLVGGTNGKGSLVAALSAVLSTGLSCGAFLKPHLKSVRERWRIADQPLSEEQFAHAAHAACDLIEVSGVELSFFEANVLLGRIAFSRARVAVEVWEVGLGGTHDACNVLDPCISVITNVQYDHQAILGDTLEQIAADKAGIARSGRALLLGPPRPGWEVSYAQYAPVI
jgi:dihydrofolate synthase/folylpolyglutamate synthase